MCMSVSSPAQTVTVGLVQMQTQPEPQLNLERAVHQVRVAAAQGAQIVCLQELFRSRYFCQTEDTTHFRLAEPIPGPTTEILGQLAASLQVVLIAPIFEQRAPGLYHNSAVIFDADGRQLGLYRKMHIPDDPAYYEKFYFAPGDLGFRSYSTPYGTVGGLVQRSPAGTNGVFVPAANRVGREGDVTFWGPSFVAAPDGQLLARAPHNEEALLLATCDLTAIATARQNW